MISELRAKSQITLPKAIVEKFGLSVGDKLEIIEKDGAICIIPVAVYPKRYVENLEAMLAILDTSTVENLEKAEKLRGEGVADYSIDEFERNMKEAIAAGTDK